MLKTSPQLYQQIEKSFQSQTFEPTYFFFGEEVFLVRQAVSYLRTMALHGCEFEFNDTSFDAAKLDISRLLEELQTLPMMYARRFVEVKNAEDLTEGSWKEILSYLKNPVDSAILLLSGGKLDKRKSSFLQAEKLCTSVEFRKPFENQVGGWIRHIAKGLGLELDDDALQVLHETVGSNLVEVEQELKKLQNFLGETRRRILIADIEQVVSQQKQWNVFELVDLVASREQKKALISVIHLLDQGQNELGLVSLLYRHYRILRSTKQGEALGFSGAKLASFAQLYPRQIDQYVKQSRQFSHAQIERAILLLAETEKAIKSSPLSSHLWIENLVLRLTEGGVSGTKASSAGATQRLDRSFIG